MKHVDDPIKPIEPDYPQRILYLVIDTDGHMRECAFQPVDMKVACDALREQGVCLLFRDTYIVAYAGKRSKLEVI